VAYTPSPELVFSQTPATSGELVFGATDFVVVPVLATVLVALGGVSVSAVAHYDNRVTRYRHSDASSRFEPARAARPADCGAAWGVSRSARPEVQSRWQLGATLRPSVSLSTDGSQARRQTARADWQLAASISAAAGATMQRAQTMRAATLVRYQLAAGVWLDFADGMQAGARREYAIERASWQHAQRRQRDHAGHSGASQARRGRQAEVARWERAKHPPTGARPAVVVPPAHSPCYTPDPSLLFAEPWTGSPHLLFVCDRHPPAGGTVVVAIKRAYIVINNSTLRRIDGDIELRMYSGSMTLDFGSWTWSWNAVLRKDALPHVQRAPGESPVELEATINGVAYRLRVVSVGRDTEFASSRIRVSGKGRAAVLAAPYATKGSFGSAVDRTAQQLANDVLTINGVPIGWEIDWGITDWLVPGGAWAFQGTYIEALNDIAASVGAYVQPHSTDQLLRILPEYPVAPWNWADLDPQVVLPGAAVQVEGTEWIDNPEYNRVFVGGVSAGVFGPFTRAGTAGDLIAPQITHSLITAPEAHRQRGLAELSRGGPRIDRTLNLQVLPETGILLPGTVLDYQGSETQRGLVRRTHVALGSPTLRQTIGVEFRDA
jgi:hypothetical protein